MRRSILSAAFVVLACVASACDPPPDANGTGSSSETAGDTADTGEGGGDGWSVADAWEGTCDMPTAPCSTPIGQVGYVDCVVTYEPAEGSDFGAVALPGVALGPPGGIDHVVSLGCGGRIVLGFDSGITDGPGDDFIVFENPFSADFPEAGRVAVSVDGCTWVEFPCEPTLGDLGSLEGCAGRTPVEALPDSGLDPLDPAVAGGDAFDLAELGMDEVHWIEIRDVSGPYWDDVFCDPGQGGKGGFDLDAVGVIHGG